MVESKGDIDKLVHNLLLDSKTMGVFPTPVTKILNYTELKLSKHDLGKIDPSFLTKAKYKLERALSKVVAAVHVKDKIVYIDTSLPSSKKKFGKLHETGHVIIPWQAEIFVFLDDEFSLSPEERNLFDQEANYFAATVLFQGPRFDDEMKKYPISNSSIRYLAKIFGSSYHAAARRYVEHSHKRCSLLVLERMVSLLNIRNYFQSDSFTQEFGDMRSDWEEQIKLNTPFYYECLGTVNIGKITVYREGKNIIFEYDYYTNGYNFFFLIKPEGEEIKSRFRILPNYSA